MCKLRMGFRYRCIVSVVLFFGLSYVTLAQISPGPLTKAHTDLEGMLSCTKCHTLGDKVSNDKCLECHTEIKSLIDARRGYHVSLDVRGQDCFKCHSDHHGKNFDPVRFDGERFNHDLTGYILTGAHAKIDCRKCHTPDLIKDPDIRKRRDTYLGLGTECTDCHTDFHQGTLGNTCTDCHTTHAFVPASEFSHAETEFPLKGAHQNVDCASCHQVFTKNNSAFQEFAGVEFTQCSSCHDDPHTGRFGANCKECHVEESFHLFRGMENFNHNKTGFPLKGQHLTISCADCHDTKTSTDRMFKDFLTKDVSNCTACHDDVHEQKFGNDCKSCHSEVSFSSVRNFAAPEHRKTDFPLKGKHETVDCRKCHESGPMTQPLPFNTCAGCHDDYHEGQFITDLRTPDCAECHTVDGFTGSTFTVEQHSQTDFALTGAHLATPCFACHLQEEKWMFRNIGVRCIDCHDDIHAGTIEQQYYPEQACINCHKTEDWRLVTFEHSLTGWALEGSHQEQTCTACHLPDEEAGTRRVTFDGLTTTCAECHDNVHRSQFEISGVTDCARCHAPEQWKPSGFDHDSARFVLEGAHLEVACTECHTQTADTEGTYALYRLEKLACADCHQ